MGIQKVGIVGLGYVGQPMVAAMAGVGYRVEGMDIDEEKVSTLEKTYRPTLFEPALRKPSQGVENA